MWILAGEAANTIQPCSSSLRTKEINFKTVPSFLGCDLFVCSEDFSVTLWSLLCLNSAPSHTWELVAGGLWVYMKGQWCINDAILLMLDSWRAVNQGVSFTCSCRHPFNKHASGLGFVSRTILGTIWSGKEVKDTVLASRISSQHMIILLIIMADTVYLTPFTLTKKPG